jgi:hypothetical protein
MTCLFVLFFLEQIQLIVGKSADSGFLNRVTYIGKKLELFITKFNHSNTSMIF